MESKGRGRETGKEATDVVHMRDDEYLCHHARSGVESLAWLMN
jgi:hypothetical protein